MKGIIRVCLYSRHSCPKQTMMRQKRLLYITLILLGFLNISTIDAQTYLNQAHREKSRDRSLEGSLHILNLCEEKSDQVNTIYKSAFLNFEEDSTCSFSDLANDSGFVALCDSNNIIHTGGPMLGNASPEGIDVWVRTLYPTKVEVKVASTTYGPVYSSVESDLTAVVKVTGLEAHKKYLYQVWVNDTLINKDKQTLFVTLPENASAKSSIAFGSCFHRWGLGNQRLIDQIKKQEPLAMLINGDIAAQDRRSNIAMHRADYLLRDFQTAWNDLAANIPVYTTWDDHDYFDNDLWGTPEGFTVKDKEAVSGIFRTSWNNPPYGSGEDGKGVYFRTRIGPADVIMLDNRYFREKGNFLGDEQMTWLKEQLLDCQGPFIILSCGSMFGDYVSKKDSWGSFDPEGREEIFSLIEENKIGGVLLISGDRHGARGFKMPRPSGHTFYEFEMGSLGGRVGPPPINAAWDTQLFGVSGEYTFGVFSFDTTLPDPEVTFKAIHERGTVFYEITLTKSQLFF